MTKNRGFAPLEDLKVSDDEYQQILVLISTISRYPTHEDANAAVEHHLNSEEHSANFKLELAEIASAYGYKACQAYSFRYSSKLVLRRLLSNALLTPELAEHASFNPAFRSRSIWDWAVLNHQSLTDGLKWKTMRDGINLLLATVDEEMIFPAVVDFWLSRDSSDYDLSRIYKRTRDFLNLDDELPDSWVRKLWLTHRNIDETELF